MSKKTATQERTYTLDELVGKMPNWWHYRRKQDTHCFCGKPASGNALIPIETKVEGSPCPDCVRIKRERGW